MNSQHVSQQMAEINHTAQKTNQFAFKLNTLQTETGKHDSHQRLEDPARTQEVNGPQSDQYVPLGQFTSESNKRDREYYSGDLTVVQSLGTTVEAYSPRKQSTSAVRPLSPNQAAKGVSLIVQGSSTQPRLRLQSEEVIVEKNMAEESESHDSTTLQSGKQIKNIEIIPKKPITKQRTSTLDPLPIYSGDIRGSEPSTKDQHRKSITRLQTFRKNQVENMNRSLGKFSHSSAIAKLSSDMGKSVRARSFSAEEEDKDESPLQDCKHLKVEDAVCKRCQVGVPFFGSVCDTKSIKTFIKVVYIDESKSRQDYPSKATPAKEIAIQDQQMATIEPVSSFEDLKDADQLPSTLGRDSAKAIVLSVKPMYQPVLSMVTMKTLFESYYAENTHLMREYMLYVINRNIHRMRKNCLISESVFEKFETLDSLQVPLGQSSELKKFLSQNERNWRTQGPDYLKFDSTLESGNLERAEVQPITQTYIDIMRSQKQPVIQKYNLFCKVDTNTKGHQQWFYFKVKNTHLDTKYQFSICNFTKPFSLFKQGMKVQMLSKRRQADHIKTLEDEITKFKAAQISFDSGNAEGGDQLPKPTLSEEAHLFMDEGIVREQWESVGTKIEYVKSKLERGGWNIPGPLNLDDEEEENVDQDDLNIDSNETLKNGRSDINMMRKRYFYQMNFEIEFPYRDDTVYLAYSRPYPYSQIIAHMFKAEEQLSNLPIDKDKGQPEVAKKRTFTCKIYRKAIRYERSLLCTTICGLPVPKISITANRSQGNPSASRRQVIFVTARVHPGETNASTVFEGFLDNLVSQVDQSPVLANFVVRLVPCMNPDGVVCGNYRSSLAGVDLNRQWILPSKSLHPEVYYTKALMHSITKVEAKKILIYCDIHCHSKKKNSFLYGCNTAGENAPFSTWTQVRLLPRLLARRSKYISLPSCKFGIDQCKLGTARVVVWKEFKVMNSFTLENSFYGYDHGPETRVYTQKNYNEIGGSLAMTLNDYRVCLSQIQQEMVTSKGWLKPIKLKEITGIPAAEVIARELKVHRQRKKKEDYIRKYHSRMAKERAIGHTFAPLASQDASVGAASANIKISQPTFNRRNSTVEVTVTSSMPRKGSSLSSNYNKDSAHNILLSEKQYAPEEDNGNAAVYKNQSYRDEKYGSQQDESRQSIVKQNTQGFKQARETTYTLLAENQLSQQDWQQRRKLTWQNTSQFQEQNDDYHDASPIVASQRVSSMVQNFQTLQLEQQDEKTESEVYKELEEADEMEETKDVEPWDARIDEEGPTNSPMRVNNWRQLFDVEELNRAYQNSILAYNEEAQKQIKKQSAPILSTFRVQSQESSLTRNDQEAIKKGEIGVSTVLVSDGDCSDDDASVDNLHEVDLYSKVYMQKEKSIERAMRQTVTAQKNFIQEVKIMIKKKNRPPIKQRPPALLPLSNNPKHSVDASQSIANMTSIKSNLSSAQSSRQYPQDNTKQLTLNGVQIESVYRKSNPAITNESVSSFKKRPELTKLRMQQPRPFQQASEDSMLILQAQKVDLGEIQSSRRQTPKFIQQQELHAAYYKQYSERQQNLVQMINANPQEIYTGSQEFTDQQQESLEGILTSQKKPMTIHQQQFSQQKVNSISHRKSLQNSNNYNQQPPQPIREESSPMMRKVLPQRRVIKNFSSDLNDLSFPQTILVNDSQVTVVQRQQTNPISSQAPKNKNFMLQINSGNKKPNSSIDIKIEHIQSCEKGVFQKRRESMPAEPGTMPGSAKEGKTPIVGQNFVLTTPAKESEIAAKKAINNQNVVEYGRLHKGGGKLLAHQGSSNINLSSIEERVTPKQRVQRKKATEIQPVEQLNEIIEGVKLRQKEVQAADAAPLNNDLVPISCNLVQSKGIEKILIVRSPQGKNVHKVPSNVMKSVSITREPQQDGLRTKRQLFQNRQKLISKAQMTPIMSAAQTPEPVREEDGIVGKKIASQGDQQHIQDHIGMTVSTLKRQSQSRIQPSIYTDENSPIKSSFHKMRLTHKDSDTQSGIDEMMQSVLMHRWDYEQNSFQEGQSSLLDQSAFKRWEGSPEPNHYNKDLDGVASHRGIKEEINVQTNSRKAKREQKVGRITVKTRDQGGDQKISNKKRKLISQKKSSQQFESITPKPFQPNQFQQQDPQNMTPQAPGTLSNKTIPKQNQHKPSIGNLSLHTHDKSRYRGNRFKISRESDQPLKMISPKHHQAIPQTENVRIDKRLSIASEPVKTTADHTMHNSSIPQVNRLPVSTHNTIQSSTKPKIPNVNQFQMYIQMSLQNLEDKSLKEAYTRQLETNQKNQKLQPINSGSDLHSPKGGGHGNGNGNKKRSIISISQRSSLFQSGGQHQQLSQKRLSMQPLVIRANHHNSISGPDADSRLPSSPRKVLMNQQSDANYPMQFMHVPLNSVNDKMQEQQHKMKSTRVLQPKSSNLDQLSHYGLGQKVVGNNMLTGGIRSSRQISSNANLEPTSSLPSISRNLDDQRSNLDSGRFHANSNSHSIQRINLLNDVKSSFNLSKADIDSGASCDSDEQRSLVNINMKNNAGVMSDADQALGRQKSRFLGRVKAEERVGNHHWGKVQQNNGTSDTSKNNKQPLRLKSLLQQEFSMQPSAVSSIIKAPRTSIRNQRQEISCEKLPSLSLKEKVKYIPGGEQKSQQLQQIGSKRRPLNQNEQQQPPNSKSLGQSRIASPDIHTIVKKVRRD